MFQILSKSLVYLLLPITWIAIALLGGVFLRNPVWKRRSLIAAVVLFFVFTNIPIVNFLMKSYEPKPVSIASLPVYEYAVVLTGIANMDMEPRDRVYYHKGADRILHAAQLYQEGKVKKILITGGTGRVFTDGRPEAGALKSTLLLHKIPEQDIVIEQASFNTHENARFSKRMLDSLRVRTNVLLITSAFHMPRAAACFQKESISFDIFPTDYYHTRITWTPDHWLLPSERALLTWNILIREWVGYVMYWLAGYV